MNLKNKMAFTAEKPQWTPLLIDNIILRLQKYFVKFIFEI